MTTTATYTFSHDWEHEQRRLELLEQAFDPCTLARLEALRLRPDARCLEIGAGRGSIARRLCAMAAEVTATDLSTTFLDELDEPRLTVLEHDVTTDDFPPGSFDLIHVRAVLEHVSDADAVVARIASWLAPGGWLVVEDFARFTADTAPGDFGVAWRAAIDAVTRAGTDYTWARTLPAPLAACGLEDIGAHVHVPLVRGGTLLAELLELTIAAAAAPALDAGLITAGELARGAARLGDETFWDYPAAFVGAWGRRAS